MRSAAQLAALIACSLPLSLIAPARDAAAAPPQPQPTPILFVPWEVPPCYAQDEAHLRASLAAKLLASGRVVEALGPQEEAPLAECLRAVNRDGTAESCWVRIGHGRGAREMLTGRIDGERAACHLVLRRSDLEERVAVAVHAARLEPCGLTEVEEELLRASTALLPDPGVPAAPAETSAAGGDSGAAPALPRTEPPTAGTAAPSVLLCTEPRFQGECRRIERSGRLPASLREQISSLRTAGSGWVVFSSRRSGGGSHLAVRASLELPRLADLPRPRAGGATLLLGQDDWDDEIESVELISELAGDPCDGASRCTVVAQPHEALVRSGSRRQKVSLP